MPCLTNLLACPHHHQICPWKTVKVDIYMLQLEWNGNDKQSMICNTEYI